MSLARQLASTARDHPQRAAIAFGTRVLFDYAALAARVARLAAGLRQACGLVPGDRVAIASANTPDYVAALYAIWHAGCVAVPANAKLHGSELGYILSHSGARVCFASRALAETIAPHAPASLERLISFDSVDYAALLSHDAMPPAPRADADLAWLFYTSGTTGRPKGAMLTHRNLIAMAQAYVEEVDAVRPGDCILHAAPMSHGSGLYIVPHVMCGGLNAIPESGGFDAAEIFHLLRAWPRSSMFAAPTMIKRLAEHAGECPAENIRTIVWGGAPMYVEDAMRALARFGPRLAQIYGQGESPMTITVLPKSDVADRAHPRWRERLGSAGRPFAGMEVVIADERGRALPQGETGEILCRGAAVMAGYWRDGEASASALAGGFLHTGDLGAFDADNYLHLKDRSKDLIISGGSNIYPREVEEVLARHPRLREVSVIGRPDRDWGEVVVAYVVGEADAAELDALCLSAIARFKRPKDYVFVDALPKNNYGKVLKTELRARDAALRTRQDGARARDGTGAEAGVPPARD